MKKVIISALAATMVLTSAMTADAGQYYKKRRGIDPGAAVAAGIIGLAAGAIIAGAANSNRGHYDDGYDRNGYVLVGYDAWGNPIYRKRPRPQPYYGDGYGYSYGYRPNPYRPQPPYYYGNVRPDYPYASRPYNGRRARDVAPEDRLRVISDRQRAYRKHCERYGCPPRY